MYLQQNSNAATIKRKLWEHATTPRMSIVKQLLRRLQEELETVNETEQVKFGENFNLYEQIKSIEIDMIRHALFLTHNNQRVAARMLGVNYTTLNSKVRRYGIE